MKKILVSKCLYGGEIVRYDAGDTTEKDPRILKWKAEGRLVPVCPEVFGGLPTPRPDSQRIDAVHVQAQTGQDVTEEYTKGAKEALRLAKAEDVAFCRTGRPAEVSISTTEHLRIPRFRGRDLQWNIYEMPDLRYLQRKTWTRQQST